MKTKMYEIWASGECLFATTDYRLAKVKYYTLKNQYSEIVLSSYEIKEICI